MAQHDYNLANQAGAAFRADANDLFEAIATQNSGTSDPSTTFPYMVAVNTTAGVKKRRNAANSGWIVESTIDESLVIARSSNTMLDVSDKGKAFRATAGFTQTFDACANLGDGWYVDYHNESSGTVVFDPNGSETISGLASISFGPGESGRIYCNGSALFVLNRSRYAGAIAAGRNITASRASASTIDIDADELQLKDANGNVYVATGVNLTVSIASSGANGLDTGSEASSTWYYGWVIYNPATHTVAGLLSTSATSPTLPSGYTYKALVTAVRNDSSSDFIAYRQRGKRVFYNERQLVSDLLNNTSDSAVSTAPQVPPIAHAAMFTCGASIRTSSGGVINAVFKIGVASGEYQFQANFTFGGLQGDDTQIFPAQSLELPNVSQAIHYDWDVTSGSNATVTLHCMGFTLPMGGE